ncbi:MAG: peptide chain release factor N(5)-glutamine methyltransferase [Nitrospirae bacterium]|nr:peptide chain release factor N(5)-glutamine methyltransferase [Candidatus Manganitrophaceae bacterium]
MPIVRTKEVTAAALLLEARTVLDRAGVPAPQLEAELLLAGSLGCRRIDLYLEPNRSIEPDQAHVFRARITRRSRREPLQYITGEVEFDGLTLAIRPGVFIPRPETELIVEEAQRIAPAPSRILDLCTGSGALAVALAKRFPHTKVVATDLNETALQTASQNAARHQSLSRITFLQGDLFAPLEADQERFDLIVCNPPYISERDRPTLPPEVRDYEPALALFAPEEGTAIYRRVLRQASLYLAPGGVLLFELGAGQSAWFRSFAEAETDFIPTFLPDFANIDRIARCICADGRPKRTEMGPLDG